MLERIFYNTSRYETGKLRKKDRGQYFTSMDTVLKMANYIIPADGISILDPGAGNGSLGAAVVMKCVENGVRSLSLTYIENDQNVLPLLRQSMDIVRDYCERNGVQIDVCLITDNFILSDSLSHYDVVIANPPYKKIRKSSPEAERMVSLIHGQPNLNALFMAKALSLLNENGQYIFITPRSWTSGSYFSKVRDYIINHLCIQSIHLFSDRDRSFTGENVLQETMILHGRKASMQQDEIQISTSSDDTFSDAELFYAPSRTMIRSDGILLIPLSVEETELIDEMTAIQDTFFSLGYIFKTGPVVEFRNKDAIFSDSGEGLIPMYRSANISNHGFVFPAVTTKPQYISESATALLLQNENTVLVRRLSAKEERRRLQSCIYHHDGKNQYISIENHVNYAAKIDGTPLSEEETEWIQSILSSERYDKYFRIINGNTQVNASELNNLPVRRMA